MNYTKLITLLKTQQLLSLGSLKHDVILNKVNRNLKTIGEIDLRKSSKMNLINQLKKQNISSKKSPDNSAFMKFGYLGPRACNSKESTALEMIQ